MLINKKKTPQTKKARPPKKRIRIVGIGCSAGGLDALQLFFDNCPADTGFAFVVIQHLSPNHKSLMPELLSRHTEMIVKEVIDEDYIEKNHVYLIPGNKNIIVKTGKLWLVSRATGNHVNFSVDLFFNSLAEELKAEAIGIILSGTGSDGTKGAKSIKEVGGAVFVQNPENSRFDGMPKSIISNGLEDFVLIAQEMPEKLINYVVNHQSISPFTAINYSCKEELMRAVLKILKENVGYDFFSYKKSTLSRRLIKRVNFTKKKSIETYIEYLKTNEEEQITLVYEFLIGVTSFFRDQEAYAVLKTKIIPDLITHKSSLTESIKIWVIACSTGEEAYSIAILMEECLALKQIENIDYKIFATDIDQRSIEIASKGIYTNITQDVSEALRSKYFIEKGGSYQITPVIRQKIIFSKHDVLSNPPFNKVDFISCRNMLIYMENDIQNQVLRTIHYSLNQNGYLFLGNSESLGGLEQSFEKINAQWKIYTKGVDVRKIKAVQRDSWKINQSDIGKYREKRNEHSFLEKIDKALIQTLMDELGTVSVCVDKNFEILHACGPVKRYFDFPKEGLSNNVLKMLPNEFSIPIITGIRRLIASRKAGVKAEELIEKNIELRDGDIKRTVKVVMRVIKMTTVSYTSFLITFLDQSEQKIPKEEQKSLEYKFLNKKDIEELRAALDETREDLQTSIEELETSNEEMQTTNEELLASNEELQSINEELQSVNEELHAVNGELQEKNTLLIELNSDVENLVKNINIGTIFLDKEFKIRKFTPSIDEHFQLRTEDIGRPIGHFSGILGGKNLAEFSANVIKTLQPYKKEIQNAAGIWFMMEIFPYRYHGDAINGVVVNFINIHDIKTAYYKEKLNDFLTHIMDANPAIIYIYDLKKKAYTYSSGSIWKEAGYSDSDVQKIGKDFFKVIVHPEDYPMVLEHHQKLKKITEGEILQIEYRLIHKNKNDHVWILCTDKLNDRNQQGEVQNILGVVNVITKAKDMEHQLKESEERFRLAIMASEAGLWEWSDVSSSEAWWSKEFQKLLGYTTQTLAPSINALTANIHPDHLQAFEKGIQNHMENGAILEQELQIRTYSDGYRWFLMNAIAQFDPRNNIQKVVGTLIDVHDRKVSENRMNELNIELERFAYLASHDLKEPLRTITSFTKLFNDEYDELLDDTAHQYMDFIGNASNRMITLTNDLLAYSQLDDKSLNFQSVDLNRVLSEIIEDLGQQIEKNKAIITYDALPIIICDMLQIRQLFQNLITNSLKYRNTKKTTIEIHCKEEKTHWEFNVKDNGIGIDPKYHKKIFEVFKRLHNRDDYEGTGIGLAYCKRIIDNHKGTIWVESSLGQGAIFHFTILKTKMS